MKNAGNKSNSILIEFQFFLVANLTINKTLYNRLDLESFRNMLKIQNEEISVKSFNSWSVSQITMQMMHYASEKLNFEVIS